MSEITLEWCRQILGAVRPHAMGYLIGGPNGTPIIAFDESRDEEIAERLAWVWKATRSKDSVYAAIKEAIRSTAIYELPFYH